MRYPICLNDGASIHGWCLRGLPSQVPCWRSGEPDACPLVDAACLVVEAFIDGISEIHLKIRRVGGGGLTFLERGGEGGRVEACCK